MAQVPDTAGRDANAVTQTNAGNQLINGTPGALPGSKIADVDPQKADQIMRSVAFLKGVADGSIPVQGGTQAGANWQDAQAALAVLQQGQADPATANFVAARLQETPIGDASRLSALNPKFASDLGVLSKVSAETAATATAPNGGDSEIDRIRAQIAGNREELNPTNNPLLKTYADNAGALASGAANGVLGATAATNAANGIPTAGLDARASALAGANGALDQAGRSAADTGIIRATANGTGPSAAAILGQQMLDQNARNMNAQAATARGGNLAAAQRAAILGGQQASLQGQQQIAAQRAAEQLAAQGLLTQANASVGNQYAQGGQIAGAVRGQDVDAAAKQAAGLNTTYGINSGNVAQGLGEQGQAAGQYTQGVNQQVNAQQQDNSTILGALNQTLGTTTGAATSNYAADTQAYSDAQKLAEAKRQANAARTDKYLSAGLGTLGALGAATGFGGAGSLATAASTFIK